MRKRGKGGPRRPSRELTIPKLFRFTNSQEQKFMMIPHDFLTQLSQGECDEDRFLTLVLRVFTGLGMAEYLSDESKAQACHVLYFGLKALHNIGERYRHLEKFGLSGDDLQDLREALNMVDALQQATTRKEQASGYNVYGEQVGSFFKAMLALLQYEQQYRAFAHA